MGRSLKLLVFVFLFTIGMGKLKSQNCAENLYSANKLMNSGNFSQCLETVKICSTVQDEAIRWQVYRLMAISYLMQGQTDSATSYSEKMLELNPNYKVNPLKDPKEFANHLNKIVVIPKFTLGLAVSAGTNVTIPHITQGYVISDYEKNYKSKGSTQFGSNLGLYLNPRWKVDVGLFATNKSFSIDYQFSDWRLNYYEKLTYLELPVSVKYIIRPYKKTRFFLNGGPYFGRLIYTQNNISAAQIQSDKQYSINGMNSMGRRNKSNFGYFAGFGVYYKLRSGQLSFATDYFHSLKGITRGSARYDYNDLVYNYFYVDDDIKLNNFSVNIGYSLYLNYSVYHKKGK